MVTYYLNPERCVPSHIHILGHDKKGDQNERHYSVVPFITTAVR